MKDALDILFKRFPDLDINKHMFNCVFIIPTILFIKSFICGWNDLSLLVAMGYMLCFFTNRLLWKIRGILSVAQHRARFMRHVEEIVKAPPRQKPNLYVVGKNQ